MKTQPVGCVFYCMTVINSSGRSCINKSSSHQNQLGYSAKAVTQEIATNCQAKITETAPTSHQHSATTPHPARHTTKRSYRNSFNQPINGSATAALTIIAVATALFAAKQSTTLIPIQRNDSEDRRARSYGR